ncbi:UNVERIFIED_CONTAM: hypothetical protein K2H54_034672 [Gekko kuhli]
MASDRSSPAPEIVPVTAENLTAALAAMEDRLLEKVSLMIKPIYDRLDNVQDCLKETRRVGDGALSNSIANHKEIKQMQVAEDLLAERTLKLDLSSHQNNLKLRGIGEKMGENADLVEFLSDWLTQLIKPDGDVSAAITKAFRLGPPSLLKTRPSRDVLITLLDLRYKKQILQEAKKKGHLLLEKEKIEIYPDLPKEAIQKRTYKYIGYPKFLHHYGK